MDVNFKLAVCLSSGREFDVISAKLRVAAEEAVAYLRQSFSKLFSIELNYVDEPCATGESLQFPLQDADAVVGPLCSLHAWQIIQTWPSNILAAVSPAADMPLLGPETDTPKFFRVCGDGHQFAANLAALAVAQIGSRRPLVVYDAVSPWWRAVAAVLGNEFVRRISYRPIMIEFDPSRIAADILRHGQRPEYYYSDLICYLGGPLAQIHEFNDLFLDRSRRRILYPPQMKQPLSKLLASTGFGDDGRVFILRFRPPKIGSGGYSHLKRLVAKLGPSPSTYVEQLYDAVLVAGHAFSRLYQEALPRTHYPKVVKEVNVEGLTGRILFDSRGNRVDQGEWQLEVWRSGTFGLYNPSPVAPVRKPGSFVISPTSPFTNVALLRERIQSCEGHIDWTDRHFSRRALQDLAFAVNPESVRRIRILSGPDNVDEKAKRDFARFAEEMMNKGINAEWRIRTDRYAHDRFFLDETRCFNVPPVNTIYEGQYSQFLETTDRPPFEDWWSTATPIEDFQHRSTTKP